MGETVGGRQALRLCNGKCSSVAGQLVIYLCAAHWVGLFEFGLLQCVGMGVPGGDQVMNGAGKALGLWGATLCGLL